MTSPAKGTARLGMYAAQVKQQRKVGEQLTSECSTDATFPRHNSAHYCLIVRHLSRGDLWSDMNQEQSPAVGEANTATRHILLEFLAITTPSRETNTEPCVTLSAQLRKQREQEVGQVTHI